MRNKTFAYLAVMLLCISAVLSAQCSTCNPCYCDPCACQPAPTYYHLTAEDVRNPNLNFDRDYFRSNPVYVKPQPNAYTPNVVYEQQPMYQQQPVYQSQSTAYNPQPMYQQPVYQNQPVYEQPMYEQPVYEQPVYEQPVYQNQPQAYYPQPPRTCDTCPVQYENFYSPRENYGYRQPNYYGNNGNCCNPCGWNNCCDFLGGLEIGVDYLYWQPMIDDLDYAAIVTVDDDEDDILGADINYKSFCPDWESGIRGYIAFPICGTGWGFRLSGLYIEFDQRKSHSADDDELLLSPLFQQLDLTDSPLIFADVDARYKHQYQEYDFLAAYSYDFNKCVRFIPYFGAAGIYTEQNLKAEFENIEDPVVDGVQIAAIEWDSTFWAAGLRVGSQYEFKFNNCFSLYGRGEGSLLVGKADNENKQLFEIIDTVDDVETEFLLGINAFDDDHCLHFVPGYRLAVGFAYEADFCGCAFSARVGYEFVAWFNMPNPRRFNGRTASAGVVDDEDIILPDFEADGSLSHSSSWNDRMIAYQGLVAGIGFRF